MRELGVLDRVAVYRILDLADLGGLEAESFDAVVCVGGPLSYLLDKESVGVQQVLRVVKPGGTVVLGVMSRCPLRVPAPAHFGPMIEAAAMRQPASRLATRNTAWNEEPWRLRHVAAATMPSLPSRTGRMSSTIAGGSPWSLSATSDASP